MFLLANDRIDYHATPALTMEFCKAQAEILNVEGKQLELRTNNNGKDVFDKQFEYFSGINFKW